MKSITEHARTKPCIHGVWRFKMVLMNLNQLKCEKLKKINRNDLQDEKHARTTHLRKNNQWKRNFFWRLNLYDELNNILTRDKHMEMVIGE